MEEDTKYPDISRLIILLESLHTSTNDAKIGIEANSSEAASLLRGWTLPGINGEDLNPVCYCSDVQKQHLNFLLEKVEKAVKYSQSVREGRNDVQNPWEDKKNEDQGNKAEHSKEQPKKASSFPSPLSVVSRTGLKPAVPSRKAFLNRDKICLKSVPKRNSGGNLEKVPSVLSDHDISSNKEIKKDTLGCPLHGTPEILKPEKPATVGLAEALDVKGVPPELVTVLKTVHRFLERLRTSRSKNKAESAFLRQLNHLNDTDQWQIAQLIKFSHTLSLCKRRRQVPMMERDDVINYTEHSLAHLGSMGIWKSDTCGVLADGSLCVQYQDEGMWQTLQTRLQQLQVAQAELEVLDILLSDVLPPLLKLSPSDSYGPAFLRTAAALSRLTTINLPAVVRTSRS